MCFRFYVFFVWFSGLPRNWFKGADTVSLLKFLEMILPEKLLDASVDEETNNFFQACLKATREANRFMTTLYHAAFWLTRSERRTLIVSGTKFTTAFRVCADHCYWADLTRFKLQPKQHMFGELVFELQVQECQNLPSPNPLVYSTQQDEDYVGRICTYSRSVSIRTIHVRTLSRYQIALATLIWFQCPGSLVPVSLPSCWARTASQSPTEMEKLVVSGHLAGSNMKSQLIRLFCGGSGDFLMEYDGILLFWYVLIHPLQYLSQNWITQTGVKKTQNRSDQNFGHFGKWPKLRAPGFPGSWFTYSTWWFSIANWDFWMFITKHHKNSGRNHRKTVVESTINHSYWSYKPT